MNTSNHNTQDEKLSTVGRYVFFGCLGGVLLVLFIIFQLTYGIGNLLAPLYPSLRKQAPPPWRGASVAVDLTGLLHPVVYEMEFAARNAPYLGLWTLEPTALDSGFGLAESGQIQPGAHGYYLVIDFQGNLVADAVTPTGALSDRYIDLFPTIAAKQRYAEFLQGAEFWAFSPDGRYGMTSDTCYEDPNGTRIMSCMNYNRTSINFKFWDLTRNELLWKRILKGYGIYLAQLVTWQGQPAVLVALPYRADILSQATGDTLGSFGYASGSFRGDYFAYYADARWLACGDFNTRRVRLYGIDPPYPLLRELPADQRPPGPWSVDGVTVNGRYLTIVASYSGMDVRHPCSSTEVYDVTTWTRVWYENRLDIWDVTVSPDGKKLAFVRSGPLEVWRSDISTVVSKVLELGDFIPTPEEGKP